MMFSVLPLSLFAFKLVKLVHLYASRVGANIRQTLAAALAGLALSHTDRRRGGQRHCSRATSRSSARRRASNRTRLIEGFAAARSRDRLADRHGARGHGPHAADSRSARAWSSAFPKS